MLDNVSTNVNDPPKQEAAASTSVVPGLLHAHRDARQIVRLVQCTICSYPLRQPMTLPCGYSLCRQCLPELHKREHITYPMIAGRQEGFICPFSDCGLEHTMGDCSADVVLNKFVEVIAYQIARYRPVTSDTPTLLDEIPHRRDVIDSTAPPETSRSRVLHGGRLVATYTFADMGELDVRSEVSYTSIAGNSDSYSCLDVTVFERLKETARSEADCQVCYGLILDPLTTPCGHTFCRKCVARVLDHANLCPICRRSLPMPASVIAGPTNKRLSKIFEGFWADVVASRAEAVTQEEMSGRESGLTLPLFICTLSYPSMPTFLHIFEPRYRLMIRRCLERDRRFGMIMYNQSGRPQPGFPSTQFMQYGTLLHIERLEMLPDGRSLIETVGLSKFKVLEYGSLDGYVVGRVERIDDIPLTDEENIEAQETSTDPSAITSPISQLEHMSTQDLLQIGLNFVARGRAASAPWLHERVLAAYGQPPDHPALFPYWLASVLPITEEEKYKLLPIASVRERLKITARWIRRLEASGCFGDEDANQYGEEHHDHTLGHDITFHT